MDTQVATTRLVALDFETADEAGHVIEIGCVEIIDGAMTGRSFYRLVNPDVPLNAFAASIHGINEQMLIGAPDFGSIADDFLGFIGEARIIAHYWSFEHRVLGAELARLGREAIGRERFICTCQMARDTRRFSNNKLRTVCKELGISAFGMREGRHDALHDARMAAEVFLRLQVAG